MDLWHPATVSVLTVWINLWAGDSCPAVMPSPWTAYFLQKGMKQVWPGAAVGNTRSLIIQWKVILIQSASPFYLTPNVQIVQKHVTKAGSKKTMWNQNAILKLWLMIEVALRQIHHRSKWGNQARPKKSPWVSNWFLLLYVVVESTHLTIMIKI